jgi:uncharacterized protein
MLERLGETAKARCAGNGPAHDFLHVTRVTETARRIAAIERASLDVVVPAALLHELFNYPKGHPQSHLSGEVCAEHASLVLREVGWPHQLLNRIADCIREHAFSRGIIPDTLEGKVLQDADRLDAIGSIGVARCFATCAELGASFYEPDDPFCRARDPDDKRWGVDHFYRKLFRIPATLHTATAHSLANDRMRLMATFLAQLEREIRGDDWRQM